MPTPIGHSLAGALIFILFARTGKLLEKWRWVFLAAFVAVLPDLDFIPGWLAGNYNSFHRGISHSVGGGLLITTLIWVLLRRTREFPPARLFVFVLCLYGSHLALDFFARDGAPPHGLKLLWPFSQNFYISPWTPLMDAHREPPQVILSPRNLFAYFSELVLFGLPLLFFRRRFSLTPSSARALQ